MSMYIPVLIVVLSNTFYHICAKSTPDNINTFASLSITYAVGTIASVLLYFITQKSGNLIREYHHLNWSSFILGIAIVGLESGYLLMYKIGWSIGTGQIVQSAILAVVLMFVGYLFFREALTLSKAAGIVICMVGLYFINK